MKLREVLELNSLRGAKPVAGASGLDNTVSDVNIIDAPDIVQWARKGEFMLTTGYCFKDDTDAQTKILWDLSGKGCAGIGIKTKRFFSTVPNTMIAAAEELGFPIIELPYYRSFSEISAEIYREILQKQASKLTKSVDINTKLTQVVLKGGGLFEIADTLSGLLDRPVTLLDKNGYLQCTSSQKENHARSLREGTNIIAGKDLPGTSGKYILQICGARTPAWITPVQAGSEILGYIVVWGSENLSDIDKIAVKHGATVSALEQLKNRAVEETKHRLRDDFFDDLLAGKIESHSVVTNLGAIHGLDVSKQYVCMVVWVENYAKLNLEKLQDERESLRRANRRIVKVVDRVSLDLFRNTVSVIRGNRVIIFLTVDDDMVNSIRKSGKEFALLLHREINKEIPDLTVFIGIGKFRRHFPDIHESYHEALQAIDMIERVGEKAVAHFEDYWVYNLLGSLSDDGPLDELYANTTKRIEEYDEAKGTDLLPTLETYLACGKNVTEAAKTLFIHRNTLTYRLNKIQELLEVDLGNPEEVLEIQLGLKVGKYLKSKS